MAAICVYDSSVVANERGGELYSDLIKAHGTVIIVGPEGGVVKSRRVGKCGVVSQVSEDRVATGIEDFDDLTEEGILRGAWLLGGDNGIHVVGVRVPPARQIMGSKEDTSPRRRKGDKLTATVESCAKRCHRCFHDSYSACLSLRPMHSLPSESRRSSR